NMKQQVTGQVRGCSPPEYRVPSVPRVVINEIARLRGLDANGRLRCNGSPLARGDGFVCRCFDFGSVGSLANACLRRRNNRNILDPDRFEALLGDAKRAMGPASASRRQASSEPLARTSSSSPARMSLSTTLRSASPVTFVGKSTPRSLRREAE